MFMCGSDAQFLKPIRSPEGPYVGVRSLIPLVEALRFSFLGIMAESRQNDIRWHQEETSGCVDSRIYRSIGQVSSDVPTSKFNFNGS